MTRIDGRDVFIIKSTRPQPNVLFFTAVGDPARWDAGFPKGIWCGTPTIARFVAKFLNKILSFGEK
jgi:hypothetical protein